MYNYFIELFTDEKVKQWKSVSVRFPVPESGTEILATRDEGGARGGVSNKAHSSVMTCGKCQMHPYGHSKNWFKAGPVNWCDTFSKDLFVFLSKRFIIIIWMIHKHIDVVLLISYGLFGQNIHSLQIYNNIPVCWCHFTSNIQFKKYLVFKIWNL